jgi:3-oxoacyl-[acyl-carrier protein] reductase
MNPDALTTMERTIPLGHAGAPEEAAGVVYLFLSPKRITSAGRP